MAAPTGQHRPAAALAPLGRRFYGRDAPTVARALLGCILVHDAPAGRTAGRIVETEAYDQSDAASHSARGLTPRTRVMFGPAGFLYVYFSYGNHWCANVVAGREGHGAAVLLRALEPLEGIELMARRRGLSPAASLRSLCSGPGRLTRAMGIDGTHNGANLCAGPIFVARSARRAPIHVVVTERVGITKAVHLPWRFVVAGNEFVSR